MIKKIILYTLVTLITLHLSFVGYICIQKYNFKEYCKDTITVKVRPFYDVDLYCIDSKNRITYYNINDELVRIVY